MTTEQGILFSLVFLIFVFLVWGRIRYDFVAFGALIVACIAGVVPTDKVFSGFGHPVVVIIALVLIVSRGLSRSGAIEILARRVIDASRALSLHIGIMAGISAALSSIMNNVAALALLMPVDMQAARKAERSPAQTLMPLSFASILGGMVTLIGTPPNIVIATFREKVMGTPFQMFDFAPVGAVVAVVGVAFITFIGWRLIPVECRKQDSGKELMDLKGYVAEVKVKESSKAVGKALRELQPVAEQNDVALLGLVRRGKRLAGRSRSEIVKKSDLIVIEGSPDSIDQFIGAAGLEYVGAKENGDLTAEAISVIEVVVPEGARIQGHSALDVRLLYRQGVALIGISRRGRHIRDRGRRVPIEAGDVLLLLGPEDHLPDVVTWLGCLPLAERGLEITQRSKAWIAIGVFGVAIIAARYYSPRVLLIHIEVAGNMGMGHILSR